MLKTVLLCIAIQSISYGGITEQLWPLCLGAACIGWYVVLTER